MAKAEFVRGRVIDIIGDTKVAVKFDTMKEIKIGSEFIIYEEGEPVYTSKGRSLGSLEIEKARVKIVHVQPEFCVGESSEYQKIWIGPPDEEFEEPPDWYEQYLWRFEQKKIAEPPPMVEEKKKQKPRKVTGIRPKKKTIEEILKDKKLKSKKVVIGDLVRSVRPI